eukprot:4906880-Pleurochrysis_carterae.AAC.1
MRLGRLEADVLGAVLGVIAPMHAVAWTGRRRCSTIFVEIVWAARNTDAMQMESPIILGALLCF